MHIYTESRNELNYITMFLTISIFVDIALVTYSVFVQIFLIQVFYFRTIIANSSMAISILVSLKSVWHPTTVILKTTQNTNLNVCRARAVLPVNNNRQFTLRNSRNPHRPLFPFPTPPFLIPLLPSLAYLASFSFPFTFILPLFSSFINSLILFSFLILLPHPLSPSSPSLPFPLPLYFVLPFPFP